MLKLYFRTALRDLRRNSVFSLINVLGLSIGISAALVIYLIVHYEFSFDQFQPDKHDIYRVVSDIRTVNSEINNAGVPLPVPGAIRREVTGIRQCAAFTTTYPNVTISKNLSFRGQQSTIFADGNYFALFNNYHWLAGSPKTALVNPRSTVLTQSRAALYFPGITPDRIIGRHIVYNDTMTATVTGIVADIKENTSLGFHEFISLATIDTPNRDGAGDWNSVNGNDQCFIKLMPGTNKTPIETQLAQLQKKYAKPDPASLTKTTHHLQPLTDIHFDHRYDGLDQPQAHKPTLYGLLIIAAFLLLLGCINFINLTTAQASHRAKEIGIRKTLGSSVPQLIRQFLGETFFLTLLSLALSLALTPWILTAFSKYIPRNIHFNSIRQPGIIAFLGILLAAVTVLAGFYPALVLSRYKPVLVLKNQAFTDSPTTRSLLVRKTLTVFQFTIAQFLIIATLIVGRQVQYSINTDLGYKKDAIVTVHTPWTFGQQDTRRPLLLERLRHLPGIELACTGSFSPAWDGGMSQNLVYRDGKKEIPVSLEIKYGDSDYIKLYRLHLLAGRAPRPADTAREFVINETTRKLLGFKTPAEAIGKVLGNDPGYPICGVMADFHQASTRTAIHALALGSSKVFEFDFLIGLRPQIPGNPTWAATLAAIGKEFKQLYPDTDYTYEFFDETIAKFYADEQNISHLLTWAAGLTILISCLGLAGLVIFTTNSRVKEIGIRKMLGASVTAIATLLSKDFVKLLIISFVIVTPVAWGAMNKWLDSYAYRAPLSWWIFPLAGIGMMAIALLTMSIRTIRTAMANPITALRTE
ncbi:MAG TPA: ABC transporter permease [Puia sp.]|uniref:ABC transporter permease n=1 Tax=Puia sp. TaxID=2045100 RepID=UPI002CDBDB20|nr:ABC transporter permease [Puia sp.]HVU95019.1 ABC transporter permease [Puia sp.]